MIRPYSRAFAMITASMYFMILAGCGGGDSGPTSPTPSTPDPPAPPPTPVATSITVAPASHTLASVGATIQLTATVRDQNNNPMTGQTVNWTSANTAVATVSGTGMVKAVSNGTSQITARSGNASGTASITVAEPVPTRIAVTPSSHTLEAIEAKVQLTATVRDQGNNLMADAAITWSSDDEAVATVDDAGLVTAVGNGTAQITARSGDALGTTAITVSQPVATSITIEPDTHTLEAIDATVQLTATVLDQHENVMEDATVTWSSDDEAVTTVDDAGLVTAVGNGTAQITARSGDASSTASITVSQPVAVATSITIEPDTHTLEAIDATVQLTATVLDQHENVMEDATVTWSSEDEAVATVSDAGLVTAVGNGTAQITARSGDALGTTAITVSQPVAVATTITIEPEAHTLEAIDATVQLTATVLDQHENVMEDATVTWSSDDEAVTTVDDAGLVTAVGNGTAQITARSGDASSTASITVSQPVAVATSITIEPDTHTLEAIDATVQLTATVLDQHENVMEDATVTWSSGDEAVTTVSEAGLVTAVRNGMADITAQSGSLSSDAAITVAQVPAGIVIAVDPDSTTLTEIDQTLQLAATVSDANDVAIEDAAVSWSSSDESVATVDDEGLVTAVGNGMADITATAGEASDMVSISVMGPSPDRETLIAIYNATDGPNWTKQDNWLSEAPVGTWYGITTNDGGRVTKLELSENDMLGLLPDELGQLAYLDSLNVSHNNISHNNMGGPIPLELGQLERLEYLNLENTRLTGPIPPELGKLERLEYLNLGSNDLTGPIPPELGQMASVERLYLNFNELSGTIPPELGQLTNLRHVAMRGNNLTGNIPPEFGQLANLNWLDLTENELSGSLPVELGQLTNLDQLELSGNNLTGNIPPEFGQLQNLRFLYLGNNSDLSGSLPGSFLDLQRLRELGLNGTQICVPPDAEFQAWLAGVDDAQGISTCEVDDGDDGEVTYVPWTGVRVDKGKLEFSASGGLSIPLTDCFTKNVLIRLTAPFPPEGLKDWYNPVTEDTLTVHYSVWQRSDDMGSTWSDIEATRVTYDACPYDPEVAGEYRLVGDITINDDRSFRRSENTFVVP